MLRTFIVISFTVIAFITFNMGIDRIQWGNNEGMHPYIAFPLTIILVGIACLIEYRREEYVEVRRVHRRFEQE